MRINKHDTNGTKPLLGKGELGYDDYVAGGDVGRVYVGTGSENIALAERLEANLMTKAQFNALAEERKANRAGSGFDEFGKHSSLDSAINLGMTVSSTSQNQFFMGRDINYVVENGSKTPFPKVNINGLTLNVKGIGANPTYRNEILLPTAPTIYPYDTVLTAEQIASGVIKHADASNSGLIVNGKFDVDTSVWNTINATLSLDSERLLITTTAPAHAVRQSIATVVGKKYIVEFNSYAGSMTLAKYAVYDNTTFIVPQTAYKIGSLIRFEFTATTTSTYVYLVSDSGQTGTIYIDNVAVYPADAISRSDLVFLESWHEDISEKNFVYPLGNTQYLGGNTDGLTGITNGAFTGFETYSLFGNWQTPSGLIGKGYVWSNLTEAQKRAFIANPENNCYLDGDKTIQVRYRVRVIQGLGDTWQNVSTNNISYFVWAYDSTSRVGIKGSKVLTNDLVGNVTGTFYVTNNNIVPAPIGLAMGGSFNANQASGYSYLDTQCFALPIALVHR